MVLERLKILPNVYSKANLPGSSLISLIAIHACRKTREVGRGRAVVMERGG
jgi:hypothetical protein